MVQEVRVVPRFICTSWSHFSFTVPTWPTYGHGHNMLKIRAGDTDVIPDDFRSEAIGFLNSNEWRDIMRR